jgi:5'-nucleotidase
MGVHGVAGNTAVGYTALALLLACSGELQGPLPERLAPAARGAELVGSAGSARRSAQQHPHEQDADEGSALQRERAHQPRSWRSAQPAQHVVSAKLLAINDFHGQLSEGRLVQGRPVGGAAVLAAHLQAAGAELEGRTLIVHAGDHVGASPPESALLQDEPAIELLNSLCNTFCRGPEHDDPRCNVVGAAGNHEFDEGSGELLRLLQGGNHPSGPFLSDPWRGARFPTLAANVVVRETGRTLLPSHVVRVLGGVRVAVIGAVLQQTPTIVTPTGVAGLEFLDEVRAINAVVEQLLPQGVRAIVVALHQGVRQLPSYDTATDPAASLEPPMSELVGALHDEVDVVVSGHAHGFSNALVPTASGHPILVTQAFSSGTAYADIELTLDAQSGDVTGKSARVVSTYADVAPGNVRHPAAQAPRQRRC